MREFDEFIEIMERLRAKDGCPWDREQTHTSLRGCMLEEAYEVAEGIDRFEKSGEYENMREELGDVLLQVVLHCQIAKEEGIFTIDDVIKEVSEKMIRRHPHVFGTVKVGSTEGVLQNWEEIKKQEKQEKKEDNGLTGIPKAFPALLRAQKVQKKADKLYAGNKTLQEDLLAATVLLERITENAMASNKDETAIQMGRLLYLLAGISSKMNISAEQSLTLAILEKITEFEGGC